MHYIKDVSRGDRPAETYKYQSGQLLSFIFPLYLAKLSKFEGIVKDRGTGQQQILFTTDAVWWGGCGTGIGGGVD